jgi:hypothetical protein
MHWRRDENEDAQISCSILHYYDNEAEGNMSDRAREARFIFLVVGGWLSGLAAMQYLYVSFRCYTANCSSHLPPWPAGSIRDEK